MSTVTVQQQQQQQKPVIKNTILPKIPQNHLPLVHVLTSRTDNDYDKVRLISNPFSLLISMFRKMNHFNSRRQLTFFSILIR